MQFTDTHTHLYLPELSDSISAVMQRAVDAGVQRFFLPNIDSESIKPLFDLVDAYPDNCFPMMGLHPCSVKENFKEELSTIEQALQRRHVYAIGEIGLDLYWDKTFFEQQKEAFRMQIRWAKQMNLPIVIHCRESFNEIMTILKEEKDEHLRGIFHCFTGSVEQAQQVIGLGFYLGIGGVLTYKNSGLDKVMGQIELRHIVLETDSPYLAPVPYRGKPNESAYLIYIAQKLADIKQLPIEEIAKATTENSKAIFAA